MDIIERLVKNRDLPDEEFKILIESSDFDKELTAEADRIRREIYSDSVYIRGLIEISNYCKNNCLYCGIRRDNTEVNRYRLSAEEILSCCREGYALGFRTFVLQGGEDSYYTDDILCGIISDIRREFPDCAITLSVGEKSEESYKRFFDAGANRYLLRHETALDEHYSKLHPKSMSLKKRKECLFNLKKTGYQVGSGFMVGSPYQTTENLIADLRFLQELRPDMIGIGPYVNHAKTPFKDFPNGSVALTVKMLSILRIMFPYALIPSTTALGTLSENGRELGLQAGANVVMPNLSPERYRRFYEIYENKRCTGSEAAQSLELLKNTVEKAGYKIVTDRGDVKRED